MTTFTECISDISTKISLGLICHLEVHVQILGSSLAVSLMQTSQEFSALILRLPVLYGKRGYPLFQKTIFEFRFPRLERQERLGR
jgi:hypothetical protein